MQQTTAPVSNKNQPLDHLVRGSLICWQSVVGGLFVSLFTYMIFSALGAGIGGITASHIIEKGGNGSGLVASAGFWLGASAIVSLFLGSYFATRFSNIIHSQVGACQAIVISAIFFYLLINVAGSSFGSFAQVAAHLSQSLPPVGAGADLSIDAEVAAKTIGESGWMLFVTLILGLGAAIAGGIEGALGNRKRPFAQITL